MSDSKRDMLSELENPSPYRPYKPAPKPAQSSWRPRTDAEYRLQTDAVAKAAKAPTQGSKGTYTGQADGLGRDDLRRMDQRIDRLDIRRLYNISFDKAILIVETQHELQQRQDNGYRGFVNAEHLLLDEDENHPLAAPIPEAWMRTRNDDEGSFIEP